MKEGVSVEYQFTNTEEKKKDSIFLNTMVIMCFIGYVILLSGCHDPKPPIYIVKTVYKHVPIPKQYTTDDITIPKPPNSSKYLEAGPIQRETMLTKHIITLYEVIGKYKIKLKTIKEYEDNITKLVDEDPG